MDRQLRHKPQALTNREWSTRTELGDALSSPPPPSTSSCNLPSSACSSGCVWASEGHPRKCNSVEWQDRGISWSSLLLGTDVTTYFASENRRVFGPSTWVFVAKKRGDALHRSSKLKLLFLPPSLLQEPCKEDTGGRGGGTAPGTVLANHTSALFHAFFPSIDISFSPRKFTHDNPVKTIKLYMLQCKKSKPTYVTSQSFLPCLLVAFSITNTPFCQFHYSHFWAYTQNLIHNIYCHVPSTKTELMQKVKFLSLIANPLML